MRGCERAHHAARARPRGRLGSSRRSAGVDLLGVGRPPPPAARSAPARRPRPRRATRPAARRRASRAAAPACRAVSSGRIGSACASAIGPAVEARGRAGRSSRRSRSSPAISARSIGAAPRQRGSSDGMDVQHQVVRQQRLLDQLPELAHADRLRARPPRSRAGASGSLTLAVWSSSMPSSRAAVRDRRRRQSCGPGPSGGRAA